MNDAQLKQMLGGLYESVIVPATSDSGIDSDEAKNSLKAEEDSLAKELQKSNLADLATARGQRVVYAKQVFRLVFGWIVTIFLLLILQMFGTAMTSQYRPLSEPVLIALISSTTVNLIGTLILVLKYIFYIPGSKR